MCKSILSKSIYIFRLFQSFDKSDSNKDEESEEFLDSEKKIVNHGHDRKDLGISQLQYNLE